MKKTIVNLCLLLSGFTLLGIFFEFIPLNLVLGGYWERPYCKWDPLTAYRFIPGNVKCSKLFDFRADIEIGKEGFRCRLPLDRQSDAPVRIMILGNSQAFSAGCDEPDSLHEQLSSILSSQYNIQNACYNLSLPSSLLLIQFDVLKKYAPVLKPTHVFYMGLTAGRESGVEKGKKEMQDKIVYGYRYTKIAGVDKNVALAYSGLAKCLTSETIWSNAASIDVLPRVVKDLLSFGGAETDVADAATSPREINPFAEADNGFPEQTGGAPESGGNPMLRFE